MNSTTLHSIKDLSLWPCYKQFPLLPDEELERILLILKKNWTSSSCYWRLGDKAMLTFSSDPLPFENYKKHPSNIFDIQLDDPHYFELIQSAYYHLTYLDRDQTLVQVGSQLHYSHRKLMMKHLASLTGKRSSMIKILQSNETILHAFAENQFMYYSELQFNSKHHLIGAKYIPYFMHASYITSHSQTFPIFYILLDGLSFTEKKLLGLQNSLLSPLNSPMQSNLEDIKAALGSIGIKPKHQMDIFCILATILHLGKLDMSSMLKANQLSCPHLFHASELLEIPTHVLWDSIARDEFGQYHSIETCIVYRDQFCILLYDLIFHWIIERMNDTTCQDDDAWTHYLSFLDASIVSTTSDHFSQCYMTEKLKQLAFHQLVKNPRNMWELDHLMSRNECNFDTIELEKMEEQMSPFMDILNVQNVQETVLDETHPSTLTNVIQRFIYMIKGDGGSSNSFLKLLIDDSLIYPDSLISRCRHANRNFFPSLTRRFSLKKSCKMDVNACNIKNEISELFQIIEASETWFLFHLEKPTMDMDECIKGQLLFYQIPQFASEPSIRYSFVMSKKEFLSEYQNASFNATELSLDFFSQLGCLEKDVMIGHENVYLSEACWRLLLHKKLEQKAVDGMLFDDDTSGYPMLLTEPFPEDTMPFIPKEHHYISMNNEKNEFSKESNDMQKDTGMSRTRRIWLTFVHCLTFCIPSWVLKKYFKDIQRQIAWREKVALCTLIFLLNGLLLFFIIGFGAIICPKTHDLSPGEVSTRNDPDNPKAAVYMYGNYYEIQDVVQSHVHSGFPNGQKMYWALFVLGRDVAPMFPKDALWSQYCPSFPTKHPAFNLFPSNDRGMLDDHWYPHQSESTNLLDTLKRRYYKGRIIWNSESMEHFWHSRSDSKLMILYDRVFDISAFYDPSYSIFKENFMGPKLKSIFDDVYEKNMDMTNRMEALKRMDRQLWEKAMTCLYGMFYVGLVDHRNDLRCQITNYTLLACSMLLLLVVAFKFIAAIQLRKQRYPETQDRFVIVQVPCYTEGEQSLRRTFQSIARLDYDYKRVLLFITCDGMIIGTGNDRPTPRIVLDILGVGEEVAPEAKAFQSIGQGNEQLNYAKVFSGIYQFEGKPVPFIVVVKVGKPTETFRPGNRGKRDSQILLFHFLSKVLHQEPMNPLEFELYFQMKQVIGVNPAYYEFLLTIDADTSVHSLALNHLVSAMTRDQSISGICGETEIANAKESWVTMLQVYEYFISHNLSKSFEKLFGSVLCLPGCFSMYRLKTAQQKPILLKKCLLRDYSRPFLTTLHAKNLLQLGEDRYLTTSLLRHFPEMKTSFRSEAKCSTNVPSTFKVLISQRRRWINSTVHNFIELLTSDGLCGFCCFSMRFVVFIDLFSTLLQPSGMIYLLYLIYTLATDSDSSLPLVSIILLGMMYGLQLMLLILKGEIQLVGWMIVHILAMPFFSFYLPLYSFLHFDDFSWGSTRLVSMDEMNESSNDQEHFDAKSIPLTFIDMH